MDGTTTIDIYAVIQPYLEMLIGLLVPALLACGIQWLRKNTGLQVSEQNERAILAAAQRAAGAALRRHGPALREALEIRSDHPAAVEAARYVERQLPKRLKQMKMTPEDVRALLATEIEKELGIKAPPEMTRAEIEEELRALYGRLVQLEQKETKP